MTKKKENKKRNHILFKIGILTIICISFVLLPACKVKSEPIDYGNDQCDFCKMLLIDNRFGCELVTSKGKVYKFDAIECMVRTIKRNNEIEENIELLLVSDYLNPGNLIDASQASFLHCNNIPSPMGEYLSAYSNADSTFKYAVDCYDNKIYTWQDIFKDFEKIIQITDQ